MVNVSIATNTVHLFGAFLQKGGVIFYVGPKKNKIKDTVATVKIISPIFA